MNPTQKAAAALSVPAELVDAFEEHMQAQRTAEKAARDAQAAAELAEAKLVAAAENYATALFRAWPHVAVKALTSSLCRRLNWTIE